MTSQSHQILVRKDNAVWREVEGETVVLDLESSTYLGINRVGTELWRVMSEGATRQDLVDHLVATYEVSVDVAGHDVDEFVEACRSRSLLEQ